MQEAQTTKDKTHGYKLDKSHIFVVNMFDDFNKYIKVSSEWIPLQTKPYTPEVKVIIYSGDTKAFHCSKFLKIAHQTSNYT